MQDRWKIDEIVDFRKKKEDMLEDALEPVFLTT